MLMDRATNLNGIEYVIGILDTNDASTSIPARTDHSSQHETLSENHPSTSSPPPASQLALSSPNLSNSTNSSLTRRTDNYGHHNRSPLNSGLWITVELVANVSQILAAVIVLSLSRHEHPRTPLTVWIIGYTAGCVVTLPHLYWRYLHRSSQRTEQDPAHSNQETTGNNHHDSNAYADGAGTHNPQQQNIHNPTTELEQTSVNTRPSIVDEFEKPLDPLGAPLPTKDWTKEISKKAQANAKAITTLQCGLFKEQLSKEENDDLKNQVIELRTCLDMIIRDQRAVYNKVGIGYRPKEKEVAYISLLMELEMMHLETKSRKTLRVEEKKDSSIDVTKGQQHQLSKDFDEIGSRQLSLAGIERRQGMMVWSHRRGQAAIDFDDKEEDDPAPELARMTLGDRMTHLEEMVRREIQRIRQDMGVY
ncbi:hypothetical protein ZIOFF_029796 [Zingiber officinale]|uniref:Uncharacterized protein n=1 Tax=Zingiber officinale TaxID=94328 RepID=A0A8J5GZ37_ZINOF|nr:hypothetical protein ZIOFF_029796 [Zingiber officinale]